MTDETQRRRAAILTQFHQACPRPGLDDIRAWIVMHPEFADDLRLHAEASLAEAQNDSGVTEPSPTLIARTRARALSAVAAARAKVAPPRPGHATAMPKHAGVMFVDIRRKPVLDPTAARPAPCAGDTAVTRDEPVVPLASMSAACGYPSPADDSMDEPVDFNDLLVRNPANTVAVRVSGESMRERGLLHGDIVVVDRARSPANGCIILGLVDGEFTIKTFRMKDGTIMLEAANPEFTDLIIGDETPFQVWGVVVGVARAL